MSKIETMIWDLDGTMLDSFGIFTDVLSQIAPKYGYDIPSIENMQANFHGTLEDSIQHSLGLVSSEEVQPLIAKFLTVQDTHYEVIEDHLFKDAVNLAQRAHAAGVRNILVTNRDHAGRLKASPRHIVEHSSLKFLFDVVICGDDSVHRKPRPEVLGARIGSIDPETTLVIGDQFVDAQFAHNLTAQGILVSRGGEPVNLHMLDYDWQGSLQIIRSLDEITL